MHYDVELMRDLMLALEPRQVSPRSNVVLALDDLGEEMGCSVEEVGAGLDLLLSLDYIDGGGQDDDYGFWLFRKLTRKGVQFIREARHPKDWERLKRHYQQVVAPEG